MSDRVRGRLGWFVAAGLACLAPLAWARVALPDRSVAQALGVAAAPGAPEDLRCTAATGSSADLVWVGRGDTYVVERAPAGSDRFAPLETATPVIAPSFHDAGLARGAAYHYRVRAQVGGELGAPSGEITVGAFQPGFAVVAPVRGEIAPAWGMSTDLVVDPNGDPMVAFVHVDPNGDTDPADGVAYFTRWDRRAYRWTDLVQIAVGVAGGTPPAPGLSLAVDAAGNPHVAYADPEWRRLSLAGSADRGVTWTSRTIRAGEETASFASFDLAIAGATAHLAFSGIDMELAYATGAIADNPLGWSLTRVPAFGGPSQDPHTLSIAPTVAIDTSGHPAIASVSTTTDTSLAAVWRPGGHAESAFDSGAFIGDGMSVGLAFRGQELVVGATLPTSYEPTDLAIHASVRGPSGWAPRTSLPYDGAQWTGGAVSLAANDAGYALIYDAHTGAGGNRCGNPKLARSADGVTWRMCSPDAENRRGEATSFSRIADSTAGDFYAAWQTWGADEEGFGVTVWRGR